MDRVNEFGKDVEQVMEESNNEKALLNGFTVILVLGLSYSLYHELTYGAWLAELEVLLALGAVTYLLSLRYYKETPSRNSFMRIK